MVLTVGINLLIGAFMWAIYRLRQEQVCFYDWGWSCSLFAVGCIAASARVFVDLPWLTVVFAYSLLVLAPLFALSGIARFIDALDARRLIVPLFQGIAGFAIVLAFLRNDPYAPGLLTAAYSAVIFVFAFYLTTRITPTNILPLRALQFFFVTHSGLMALEVAILFGAWSDGKPPAAFPVLDVILVSHILLANATALTFPLLAFVRSEQKLRALAESDALTGLYNRRAFYSRGSHAFRAARQAGEPFTVLMIDLDHFKQINDRWGHAVGDEVLRFMARLLRDELRETDIVGRIGGEEFAVALPHTTEAQARCISERLCQRVFELGAVIAGEAVNLSASFGGVHREARHTSFSDMLMQADSAMYSAKDQGRNTVFFEVGVPLKA